MDAVKNSRWHDSNPFDNIFGMHSKNDSKMSSQQHFSAPYFCLELGINLGDSLVNALEDHQTAELTIGQLSNIEVDINIMP